MKVDKVSGSENKINNPVVTQDCGLSFTLGHLAFLAEPFKPDLSNRVELSGHCTQQGF